MIPEFEKEHSPIWCEECNQQGYIFIDDMEGSCFVVCKTCGWETSDVWCSTCGMGGEFIQGIKEHPLSWKCSTCKSVYDLPKDFYTKPVTLFTESELPQSFLNQIDESIKANRLTFQQTLMLVVKLMVSSVVFFTVMLLPALLIFTPLPWTIPGFVVLLLIFVMWWWLASKGFKILREKFPVLD